MNNQTLIRPATRFPGIDFNELWNFRELFLIFAWRDIKVRYKQTLLGILWVVFQPLFSTVIFTVFFGNLAKIPSGNLPYSLFVLTGLVYWNFFQSSLSHASNSLIDNENIIKKVYFPKIILPLSSVITSFIDFGINFLLLLIYMLILDIYPTWLLLPVTILGVLIGAIASSGLGLFLSSVNIKYRDVRYILPFFTQILLFVSPVIYPTSIVRPANKILLGLNPMTGVIESVRYSISPSGQYDWSLILISLCSAFTLFIIGIVFFRSTEKYLADVI